MVSSSIINNMSNLLRAAVSFNKMSNLLQYHLITSNLLRAAVSFNSMSNLWRAAVSFNKMSNLLRAAVLHVKSVESSIILAIKEGNFAFQVSLYSTPTPLSVCLIRIGNLKCSLSKLKVTINSKLFSREEKNGSFLAAHWNSFIQPVGLSSVACCFYRQTNLWFLQIWNELYPYIEWAAWNSLHGMSKTNALVI